MNESDTDVFSLARSPAPDVMVARADHRRPAVVVDLDDAGQVLPPLDGATTGSHEPDASGAPLWHTVSFAAVAQTATPRRKVRIAAAVLLAALVATGGFVGFQAASIGGLLPPSPPRHVVADDALFRQVLMPEGHRRAHPRTAGPTARPPEVGGRTTSRADGARGDAVHTLRSR